MDLVYEARDGADDEERGGEIEEAIVAGGTSDKAEPPAETGENEESDGN